MSWIIEYEPIWGNDDADLCLNDNGELFILSHNNSDLLPTRIAITIEELEEMVELAKQESFGF
jgi:hypothetical protein